MHLIDWSILVVFIVALIALGIYTRRYMKSVADFLAAGRCADRFMLTVAGGATIGTISVVALFEAIYASGFAPQLWNYVFGPIGLLITLSGFVIYRFRETKALTLAQFFEVRYSRNFRVFSGIMSFTSGIINYGIFPGVSARFFVYFCGLPEHFPLAGYQVPTFAVIMAILLALALFFTFLGGQITIIITDFAQGLFMNITLFVILIVVLGMFPWSRIAESLINTPPNQSLVNPFQTSQVKDFNFWYYLMGAAISIYSVMSWQGSQAFNAAPSSPHEAKMGQVLGTWRSIGTSLVLMMLPICAYTYMHHPAYAEQAALVNQKLALIDGQAIRTEMTVPLAIAQFLPHGLIGMFCTIMVAMFITCDDIYLHSWGSIFIQDVILPLRKKPFTPKQHIRMLRWSILGVAVFAFIFSLFIRPTEYIYMYMAITGAIYMGGSGSAIIGGLYWKRGTTAAAWAGMITGSSLAVMNIVTQQLWDHGKIPVILSWLWSKLPFLENYWKLDALLKSLPSRFPINGMTGYFFAVVAAIAAYVVISLIQNKRFDLEKMLHRDEKKNVPTGPRSSRLVRFLETIGMTGTEFTRGDKILYLVTFSWSMGWSLVFIGILICHFFFDISSQWWLKFWRFFILHVPLTVSAIVIPLFFTLGFRDAIRMFRRLNSAKRNTLDDGTVVNHSNLSDTSVPIESNGISRILPDGEKETA